MPPLTPIDHPPPAWGRVPLLPVAVAIVVGVLVADWLDYSGGSLWWWTTSIALIVAGGLQWVVSARRFLAVTHSVVLVLAIFSLAVWRSTDTHLPNHPDFFANHEIDGVDLAGIVEAIRPGERSLRIEVDLRWRLLDSSKHIPTLGRLLLYVPPDERAGKLKVGDGIVFGAEVRPFRPPLNPGVFDLRSYWKRQHVYHQAFIRDPQQYRIVETRATDWRRRFAAWREAWFNTFRSHLKGDELAVATALVLGKRDLLTTEIRSAYADTGAMHVLAVSGLHVGIVYLLLLSLLGWLRRWRWGRYAVAALSLMGIWAFAAVTGWSPSVQRAAIMFSAIVVGGLSRRKMDVFNALALAAIIMLLVDPQQLFAVGFQLSFSALTGIVLFTRHLEKALFLPVAALRKAWSAVSASVGAQLGTLPLALHYFKQFPLYFMLSGTVVVITAYFALLSGVFHGFLAGILGWDFGARITGWLLSLVVSVQNAFVFYFGKLPYARLEIMGFGWPPAFLLALGILGLAAWSRWRKWGYLAAALIFSVLSFVWARTQVQGDRAESQAIVYHLSRQTLIDVFTPAGAVAIGAAPDPADLPWSAGPSRRRYGVDSVRTFPLAVQDTAASGFSAGSPGEFTILGQSVLVLDGSRAIISPATLPDVVLVVNDFDPRQFPDLDSTTLIVVDGSNPPWRGKAWRELAGDRGMSVHLTAEDGAFILESTAKE